jgi:hypothetical protein
LGSPLAAESWDCGKLLVLVGFVHARCLLEAFLVFSFSLFPAPIRRLEEPQRLPCCSRECCSLQVCVCDFIPELFLTKSNSSWRRLLAVHPPGFSATTPPSLTTSPGEPPADYNPYVLFGIGGGIVVAMIVIVIVIVVVRRRRRKASIVYTPLNDMLGGTDTNDLATW